RRRGGRPHTRVGRAGPRADVDVALVGTPIRRARHAYASQTAANAPCARARHRACQHQGHRRDECEEAPLRRELCHWPPLAPRSRRDAPPTFMLSTLASTRDCWNGCTITSTRSV